MFFHPEFNKYNPPDLKYKIEKDCIIEIEEVTSDKERYFLYMLYKENKIKEEPLKIFLRIFDCCDTHIINHIGLDILKTNKENNAFYESIFELKINLLLLNDITKSLLIKFNGDFTREKWFHLEMRWLKEYLLLRNVVFYAIKNHYESFNAIYQANTNNMNDIEITNRKNGEKMILFSDLYFNFLNNWVLKEESCCDIFYIYFFTNENINALKNVTSEENFLVLLELFSYTDYFYEYIRKNIEYIYKSQLFTRRTYEIFNTYINTKTRLVRSGEIVERLNDKFITNFCQNSENFDNLEQEFYQNLFVGNKIEEEYIIALNEFAKNLYLDTSKENISNYFKLISGIRNLNFKLFNNLFMNFLSAPNLNSYAKFLTNSDKFIPIKHIKPYISKKELFLLFKEFFKNLRSTDFIYTNESVLAKEENISGKEYSSIRQLDNMESFIIEKSENKEIVSKVPTFFHSSFSGTNFYQNFITTKNTEVLNSYIYEFLTLILESNDPDFIYLLPLIPYIPPNEVNYNLIYKIYILLFSYNIPNLILFNIKTPALLVSNIIVLENDNLIDNLFQITLKLNLFDIFENNSIILFLGIIYYSESEKLKNFNFTGIIDYVNNEKIIGLLGNNLLLLMVGIHNECKFNNKSFNKRYVNEILRILLSKYTQQNKVIWHTSEKIFIKIIKIVMKKDKELAYDISFYKITSYIIKLNDKNKKFIVFNNNEEYISLFHLMLSQIRHTPYFLNYVIIKISDYKYFINSIVPLGGENFDDFINGMNYFIDKIKTFPHDKSIIQLFNEYRDQKVDWLIDLFHLKSEFIDTAISLLKLRFLSGYDFNDLFLLLYLIDYNISYNYDFYVYLYLINRKKRFINKQIKCNGIYKYYFYDCDLECNTEEESVLLNNYYKVSLNNSNKRKEEWIKEVKSVLINYLQLTYSFDVTQEMISLSNEIIKNINIQSKSIIGLINDPFKLRIILCIKELINQRESNIQSINNSIKNNISLLYASEVCDKETQLNKQLIIYKEGFTYKVNDYFITEDSITPLDLVSLIYFNNKLYLFYLSILDDAIINYLLPQLIQLLNMDKELINVFKGEEVIHNTLFLLLSNICDKCYLKNNIHNQLSIDKSINIMKDTSEEYSHNIIYSCDTCKIYLECYFNLINNNLFIESFNKQMNFIKKLKGISEALFTIRLNNKTVKKILIDKYIENMSIEKVYLPFDYRYRIKKIVNNSGVALQSAAKVPFMITLEIEDINKSINVNKESNRKIIIKLGDDCRQDSLVIQIIQLFNEVFINNELNIELFPYKVITIRDIALIECIPDAITRDEMGKQGYNSITDYFECKFGFRETKEYDDALQNFVNSYVGYSLLTYFVNIKDRHNANILIHKSGKLMHIDFGFIMELSPGNLNFELPVKLTTEIHSLLKSGTKDYFEIYKEKMVEGFLAIRKYSKEIINLVKPFEFLPCFKKNGINNLISRIRFDLTDSQCKEFVLYLIEVAKEANRTWIYDTFQYLTNDIRF